MPEQLPQRSKTVDVVIIGAGPSGATAAATLARAGWSVLLLERRAFPRFHIGESMLPYMAALVDQMGLLDRIKAQGYVVKRGAEFIFPDGDYRRVDFSEQGPGRHGTTFQVERAHFDALLADHARECGATVVSNAQVQDLILEDKRVTGVSYTVGERIAFVRARYVIDAGGRLSLISRAFKLRKAIERLRMVAVFHHLTGLEERHNPGHEGDIQIGGHADGWLWAIPIWPDTISVGAVMPRSLLQGRKHESVLREHLARVPRIRARLRGATPSMGVRVETDYCYYTDTVAGPGWFLVGDAGCFIDPIFSAGVFLAMTTGRAAAQSIDRILSTPSDEEEVQLEYSRLYKTGYDTYTRLIYAYYESAYNLGRYLKSFDMDVNENMWFARLLSGDFWERDNPFGEFLRAETRWDTFAPFDRLHRCPIYPKIESAERALVGS